MLAHGRVPIRSRATAFIGALRSTPWTAPPAPTASANDATRKPGLNRRRLRAPPAGRRAVRGPRRAAARRPVWSTGAGCGEHRSRRTGASTCLTSYPGAPVVVTGPGSATLVSADTISAIVAQSRHELDDVGRCQGLVRTTSRWVARVIAT